MNPTPSSKSTYLVVWVALMVLLALTWLTAEFNLGVANTIVALVIALAKMLLVILFFMQVRYHSRLTWLFAAAGFVWLLIMITFTLTDYLSRRVVTPYDRETPSAQVQPSAPPKK